MKEEIKEDKVNCDCCEGKYWKHRHHHGHRGGGSGAIYCLGVIGALIYYFPHVITFQDGLIAVFKSLTWPAYLVFRALQLLKM